MIIRKLREAMTSRFRSASRMLLFGLCLSVVLSLAGLALAGSAMDAIVFLSTGDKPEKPYALIFGTVWGPNDHPLYGVRVKIRREDEKKARWELYSDHHGEFAQRVPAGKQDYVIWADVKDRKSENGNLLRGEEVKVHVDADERVDTGLHLK